MSRYSVRFLTQDEIDLLKLIIQSNPYSNGIKLSEEQVNDLCNQVINGVKKGFKKVAITFDSENNPLGLSIGTAKPGIAGWIQGLTLIKDPGNFENTVQILSIAMDHVIDYFESIGYYKFWDSSLEKKILTIFKGEVSKISTKLKNYNYYDERIIPPGEIAGVDLWDKNRRINPTKPILVRMYVLKQEHRLPLINSFFKRENT